MERITINIGERATLAAMTASAAATLTANLIEQFGREVMRVIDTARTSGGVVPASITQFPVCQGCGMSVAKGVLYCVVCRDKPQYAAPRATIEVGAQPKPAYADAPTPQVPR